MVYESRRSFLGGLTALTLSSCVDGRSFVGMSTDELMSVAGSILCFPIHASNYSSALESDLRKIQPAGYVVFSSPRDGDSALRAVVSRLRRIRRGPIFIATDEEGGTVQRITLRTPLPSAMSVAATSSTALARSFGRCLGAAVVDAGIDTVLGPVLELATAESPLGTRAFSDNISTVATMGREVILGIHDAGAKCVLKHYPGYAFAVGDPEKTRCFDRRSPGAVSETAAQFAEVYGVSSHCVMSSHAAVSAIDQAPASLSSSVIQGLRRTMPGAMVLSDALDMPAVTLAGDPTDLPVRAIRAGVDCLLYSNEVNALEAVRAIVSALRRGDFAPSRLAEAAQRVGAFGRRGRLRKAVTVNFDATASAIAQRSITAINQAGRVVQRVSIIVIAEDDREQGARLSGLLSRAGIPSTIWYSIGLDLSSVAHRGRNQVQLVLIGSDASAARLTDILAKAPPANMVFLCTENPFQAKAVAQYPLYLTYGSLRVQLEAFARALSGSLRPDGRLPIQFSR
jgi:beta-N-acetylhexosaminidase